MSEFTFTPIPDFARSAKYAFTFEKGRDSGTDHVGIPYAKVLWNGEDISGDAPKLLEVIDYLCECIGKAQSALRGEPTEE